MAPIIAILERQAPSDGADDEPELIGADAAAGLRFLVEFGARGGDFAVEDDAVGAGFAGVAADAVVVEGGVVLDAGPAGLFGLGSGETGGGASGAEGVVAREVVLHFGCGRWVLRLGRLRFCD
ncbi:hypothetical protein XANCAGTX0491_005561 [Xanthoria calcicola]